MGRRVLQSAQVFLALVDELNVFYAKSHGVKTNVVHSSLEILTIGVGCFGIDPDIQGGNRIYWQVLDNLNLTDCIPFEITPVDKGAGYRTDPTVRANDVVPLIPAGKVMVAGSLIGVRSFSITVMNKRRTHVIGIPQPDGIIPSGTSEKAGPGIADIALRVNPKGNGILVQGHLRIVGEKDPVIASIEVESSSANAGQPLGGTAYGSIQFVSARIRGNRNRGIFIELPMPDQVGTPVSRGRKAEGFPA